jgi:hypothetical protein
MLFFWMPHEDAVAVQYKWIDGGFYAPGFTAGVTLIDNTGTARVPAFNTWLW